MDVTPGIELPIINMYVVFNAIFIKYVDDDYLGKYIVVHDLIYSDKCKAYENVYNVISTAIVLITLHYGLSWVLADTHYDMYMHILSDPFETQSQ